MDVSLLIKQRLTELGLDQKDLAAAARVTESYISQLLARKKAPPAPGRTDIYEKIGQFLRLPAGELAKLAEVQRRSELKKKANEPAEPLFKDFRELILRKCDPDRQDEVRRILEKEPFGELERLVARKVLDSAQSAAREELRNDEWLRSMARLSGSSFEQTRVGLLEFLDTDISHIALDSCVLYLDPMIESWDIDLRTFALEVVLSRRLGAGGAKRFEFVEKSETTAEEPGLQQFLNDASLSAGLSAVELEFLKSLKFNERRPTALYYYREVQNLRDPLHFTERKPT